MGAGNSMIEGQRFPEVLKKAEALIFNYSFHKRFNNHKKYYKYAEARFKVIIDELTWAIGTLTITDLNIPSNNRLIKVLDELIEITKANTKH